MGATHRILTPLPQLKLGKEAISRFQVIQLGERLVFSPMTARLYRSLVNLAKEKHCSDDNIILLQEAGCVFWAEIPGPMPAVEMPLLSGVMYSSVADGILQRLFDCLLLFGYVPKPFRRFLWFFTSGTTRKIETKSLKMLEPEWNYYDWEIKYAEPAQAHFMLHAVQKLWNKLSPVLGIESLNATFTNKKKHDVYLKAGNDNIVRKTEELVKARYGPDAHFVEPEIADVIHESHDEQETDLELPILPIKPSGRQTTKWFIEGWQSEYFKEIEKIDRKQYKEPSGRRFHRAFQIFTAACRLQNPHRFAALMTRLEALFCTVTREITFQLASRIAWFLEPDNIRKRKKLFADVKDLYDIRSKIVHGGKYSISKIEDPVNDLEDLVRDIFNKILSDEKVYSLFFNKDQNVCNEYLDGLNLGES